MCDGGGGQRGKDGKKQEGKEGGTRAESAREGTDRPGKMFIYKEEKGRDEKQRKRIQREGEAREKWPTRGKGSNWG
jgi:hypothetical protein